MTCSTCGRENPPHLTFCQECGQRLGPRIAPPTPPIGLGGQDAYGPPNVVVQERPRVATALGMTGNMPDLTPAAPPVQPQAAGGDRRCKICDTINGPNLRYCTSCGSTLEPAPSPVLAAAPVAASPPAFAPAALSGAIPEPPHAIAPMRVVDLGTGGAPAVEPRICARCRGTADTSAQFCKFCGNSLADAVPVAFAAPAAAPPAPVAPAEPRTNGEAHASPRAPTAPIGQVTPQVMQAMHQNLRPAQGLSSNQAAAPAPTPAPVPVQAAPPQPQPASPYGPPPQAAAPYGPPPQASGAAALAAAIQPQAQARASASPAPAPAAVSRVPAVTPQRGRLVVIAKSGADGPSYPFGDLLDIGRTEGNVIVGEDPYLSPRHVRILFQNGKFTLRDLASTNGVFLRLAPSRDTTPRRSSDNPEVAVPLVDNDLILVGQQVLRFDILKEGEGGFGPAQEHGTLLFGSPAAPRYARLCQRTVEGIARDVYYVRKVETVLGRESGDVVFTEDPFLSRRHAAIRLLTRDGAPAGGSRPPPSDARFALVDLGSSNGTFLRIRGDVELAPGDHFRVGQQLFRVDFDAVQAQGARGQ